MKKVESTYSPLVSLEEVSFSYANGRKSNGVSNITLSIVSGEAILLCGPSGCGKSSITRIVNGLIPHYYEGNLSGCALLDNKPLSKMELYEIAQLAGSVFQNPRSQFYNIDVIGEVAFTCENLGLPKNDIINRVNQSLKDFDLEKIQNSSLFDLSGGQKQRVACASISAPSPKLYILDEPSSNLDANSIQKLRQAILQWKKSGAAILIAEHRLYYLAGLIDTVYQMKEGSIVAQYTGIDFFSQTPQALSRLGLRTSSLEMLQNNFSYLKDDFDLTALSALKMNNQIAFTHSSSKTIELHNFTFSYKRGRQISKGISIPYAHFRKGSIVALIGKNGAGKSTFANCLAGIKKAQGTVIINNKPFNERKRRSLAYLVMQDVNHQLFCETVLDEVLLGIDKDLDEEEKQSIALKALNDLDLTNLSEEHPRSLSGGEKQRVCIAAALTSKRPIVILDEPTSGLDYFHMKQTANVVRKIAHENRTVFVITHDPEFILSCCTEVCRFHQGEIIDQYSLNEAGIKRMMDYFAESSS